MKVRKTGERTHAQIARRLRDVHAVEAVLQQAARRAIVEHARAGRMIAIWHDNRVVWEKPTVVDDPSRA